MHLTLESLVAMVRSVCSAARTRGEYNRERAYSTILLPRYRIYVCADDGGACGLVAVILIGVTVHRRLLVLQLALSYYVQ